MNIFIKNKNILTAAILLSLSASQASAFFRPEFLFPKKKVSKTGFSTRTIASLALIESTIALITYLWPKNQQPKVENNSIQTTTTAEQEKANKALESQQKNQVALLQPKTITKFALVGSAIATIALIFWPREKPSPNFNPYLMWFIKK
jgi:hypothetical protein